MERDVSERPATVRRARLLGWCGLALLLQACTAQQGYSAVQEMRRNECNRQPDKAERDRCLAGAAASYDDYSRQRREQR